MNVGQRASPRLALLALPILLAGGVAFAENIDPGGDGSRYAWGENLGWINAEPSGNGGPGVQVSDFGLTGYMWGENAGWISLSCTNQISCSTASCSSASGGGYASDCTNGSF